MLAHHIVPICPGKVEEDASEGAAGDIKGNDHVLQTGQDNHRHGSGKSSAYA
jgi:hypothetical protein